ncbi:MAG: hypothetical protein JSV34_06725, partial [Candidatus Omnitrophota bacterium]
VVSLHEAYADEEASSQPEVTSPELDRKALEDKAKDLQWKATKAFESGNYSGAIDYYNTASDIYTELESVTQVAEMNSKSMEVFYAKILRAATIDLNQIISSADTVESFCKVLVTHFKYLDYFEKKLYPSHQLAGIMELSGKQESFFLSHGIVVFGSPTDYDLEFLDNLFRNMPERDKKVNYVKYFVFESSFKETKAAWDVPEVTALRDLIIKSPIKCDNQVLAVENLYKIGEAAAAAAAAHLLWVVVAIDPGEASITAAHEVRHGTQLFQVEHLEEMFKLYCESDYLLYYEENESMYNFLQDDACFFQRWISDTEDLLRRVKENNISIDFKKIGLMALSIAESKDRKSVVLPVYKDAKKIRQVSVPLSSTGELTFEAILEAVVKKDAGNEDNKKPRCFISVMSPHEWFDYVEGVGGQRELVFRKRLFKEDATKDTAILFSMYAGGYKWASRYTEFDKQQDLTGKKYLNIRIKGYGSGENRPGFILVQLLDKDTPERMYPPNGTVMQAIEVPKDEVGVISISLDRFKASGADLSRIRRVVIHYGEEAWLVSLNKGGSANITIEKGWFSEEPQGEEPPMPKEEDSENGGFCFISAISPHPQFPVTRRKAKPKADIFPDTKEAVKSFGEDNLSVAFKKVKDAGIGEIAQLVEYLESKAAVARLRRAYSDKAAKSKDSLDAARKSAAAVFENLKAAFIHQEEAEAELVKMQHILTSPQQDSEIEELRKIAHLWWEEFFAVYIEALQEYKDAPFIGMRDAVLRQPAVSYLWQNYSDATREYQIRKKLLDYNDVAYPQLEGVSLEELVKSRKVIEVRIETLAPTAEDLRRLLYRFKLLKELADLGRLDISEQRAAQLAQELIAIFNSSLAKIDNALVLLRLRADTRGVYDLQRLKKIIVQARTVAEDTREFSKEGRSLLAYALQKLSVVEEVYKVLVSMQLGVNFDVARLLDGIRADIA